jgi:hypothetical protein
MSWNPQHCELRGPRTFLGILVLSLALGACDSDSIVDGGGGNGDGDDTGPTVTTAAGQVPTSIGPAGSVVLSVTAQDDASGTGLQQIGMTLVSGDSVIVMSELLDGEQAATRQFTIPVGQLPFGALQSIQLQYYGWAIDRAGNCTLTGSGGSVECSIQNGRPVVGNRLGFPATLRIIDIRTFQGITAGAQFIGDLVVDTERNRVYVSNKANNAVEVFDWDGANFTRQPGVHVGAQPWGMTLDLTGDSLIVANSGGTSLSYVALDGLIEARRFETPNAVLYQLFNTDSTTTLEHLDFADRPQFVAQDASGVIFYSTRPTSAAPDGSIRMVQSDPAWLAEQADILLWTQVIDNNAWGPGVDPAPCYLGNEANLAENCVIAFADSVKINYEAPTLGTQLEVYDHRPGFPNQVIADTSSSYFDIIQNLRSRGSDILFIKGDWAMDEWMTGDTTFVAASGNREWIGIAEGAANPGRVWMWGELGAHPPLFERLISDVTNISDYVNNTSDRVTGLALNEDGLVLASRSGSQVFFFTNPMRLRGTFEDAAILGGTGLAIHPEASFDIEAPESNWAVVGGAGPELIIVDTRHFRRVGTIAIGEPVGGALRITAPLATDDSDVIAHVFGVTRTGGIFEVAVRSTDVGG